MSRPSQADDTSWLTPAGQARSELRVRGSRFLAVVAPVEDEAAAAAHLEQLEGEFPRATHHCWAFRMHRHRQAPLARCQDAGEPHGTAGAPILRALENAGAEGASLVVVRWFGGTKLGTGPLARAYGEAAAAALQAAGLGRCRLHHLYRVRFPYTVSGEVRRALEQLQGRIRGENPGEVAELEVTVPEQRHTQVATLLGDASRGRADVEAMGTVTVKVPL